MTSINQAICQSRESDTVVRFVSEKELKASIITMIENNQVWGMYYLDGEVVAEDIWGYVHENVLLDKTIYESENGYFYLDGIRPKVSWLKLTKLGRIKQSMIREALSDPWVDKVYRRGNKGFKLLLNGVEQRLW